MEPNDIGLNISLEQLARFAATLHWTQRAYEGVESDPAALDFLKQNPYRDHYVDEWWEELFLPLVLEWMSTDGMLRCFRSLSDA